jgi:hypothetical protein
MLATRYRQIAPDLPSYGFPEVPSDQHFQYTFADLASTIAEFLDALLIKDFAVYIFDYGAPRLPCAWRCSGPKRRRQFSPRTGTRTKKASAISGTRPRSAKNRKSRC